MTTKDMMQKPCQVLNVFFKWRLQHQMEDTLSSHSNPHPPYSFSLPQDALMTVFEIILILYFLIWKLKEEVFNWLVRVIQAEGMKYSSNNSRAEIVIITAHRNQSVKPKLCLSLKH